MTETWIICKTCYAKYQIFWQFNGEQPVYCPFCCSEDLENFGA